MLRLLLMLLFHPPVLHFRSQNDSTDWLTDDPPLPQLLSIILSTPPTIPSCEK
jgi:hypothetical protein